MGNGIRLGSILGFEVRIDYSWFVIFFLILWSLSAGVFPDALPDQPGSLYLAMGTAATLLFFASLLAHELSHSLVARTKGIPVEGITLFIFGGVAHTRMEAEEPVDELLIAGIGPVVSFALGALFLGVAALATATGWPPATARVAEWLGVINVVLAVFNLLPGFPLDGGRLFRALAWKSTGDLTKATRWATNAGKGVGYLLMGLGILQAFAGAVMGGLWLVFIGWFLRGAADMSFQQHLLGEVLEGVRAGDLMTREPESVPPEMTVQELVDDHFLKRRYQSFPVVDRGALAGLVTLDQVKSLDRGAWPGTPVSEIMIPRSSAVVVDPAASMSQVLEEMRDAGARRVLVARDGDLVGLVSGSDVLGWAQRARELGGSRNRPREEARR